VEAGTIDVIPASIEPQITYIRGRSEAQAMAGVRGWTGTGKFSGFDNLADYARWLHAKLS
jgi:hypothetical protein